MKNQVILSFIAILFSGFLFSQEESEKHPILTDRFKADVGIFLPSKNIRIGAEASGILPGEGTEINFGESFGFNDNEATLFLNFEWRFAKKWKLGVEYFAVKNADKAELEEDIVFDDITFKKGTNIIVIDPDVAEYFSDSKTINDALRSIIPIIKQNAKKNAEQKH